MQAIHCKLPDLGRAFAKMKSQEASEKRKAAMIEELTHGFLMQGKSLGLAECLAREKYLLIHKNKNHG